MRWAHGVAISITLAFAVGASPARADISAENRATAQVLFDQGKELVAHGRYAEACPKFEESQRLDPRIPTQFKLADCFEHVGKTASAWASYVDVVTATKAAGQADREQVARERAAAMEKKLSKLTLKVSGADVPGLRILRDGSEVGRAQWENTVPIDPGEHTLTASAPGKKPWQSTFTVGTTAGTMNVNIPDLVDDPTAVGPVGSPSGPGGPGAFGPQVPASNGNGQRIAGGVIGGLGLAGIAIGTVFGLQAKSKLADAAPHCRTASLCTQDGLDLTNDAKGAATVSTVSFIAGGTAVAAGIVLFFTAPSSRPAPSTGTRLLPVLGPRAAGCAMTGVW